MSDKQLTPSELERMILDQSAEIAALKQRISLLECRPFNVFPVWPGPYYYPPGGPGAPWGGPFMWGGNNQSGSGG